MLDGCGNGRPRGRRIQRTTGMSKAASRIMVLRRGATALDAPATLVQHKCVTPDNTTNGDTHKMFPRHLNSVQWEQALGYARQACARIFRDGGSPQAALKAFGLADTGNADWSAAVDRIAQSLCAPQQRKAA